MTSMFNNLREYQNTAMANSPQSYVDSASGSTQRQPQAQPQALALGTQNRPNVAAQYQPSGYNPGPILDDDGRIKRDMTFHAKPGLGTKRGVYPADYRDTMRQAAAAGYNSVNSPEYANMQNNLNTRMRSGVEPMPIPNDPRYMSR